MAQPTAYTPATDFSDYESSNPGIPMSGTSLDVEFAALNTTTDEILANLALIQNDDTTLKNASVHPDALNADVKSLMVTDWNPRGAWVTSTAYAAKDIVTSGSTTYICVTAHTSGTFATDANAGKWMALSGTPSTAADISFSNSASGLTATTAQAAIDELDTALDAAVSELATLPAASGANVMVGVNAAGDAWELKTGLTVTTAGVIGAASAAFSASGSAAAPAISFGDANDGFYNGSTFLGVSVDGALRSGFTTSGFFLGDGGTGKAYLRTGDSAAAPPYSFGSDLDTGMFRAAADTIGWATGGTSRMLLDNSGLNVVIGATTPAAGTFTTGVFNTSLGVGGSPGVGGDLEVMGTAAATFETRTTSGGRRLAFLASDSSGALMGTRSNHPLAIMTNNSQVADFDTSGNLNMANAAGPALMNEAATATNPTLVPNKADTDTGIGWVSADIGSLVAGGVSSLQFHTAGFSIPDGVTAPSAVTGRAIIYVDTADGDLKVKFADGHTTVVADGAVQLQETGTWTPVVAGQTTAGTQTYSNQSGTYVRVGDMVTATFEFSMTAKDVTTDGNVRITGLPFAANSTTIISVAAAVASYDGVDIDVAGGRYQVGSFIQAGTSFLRVFESGDNVASASIVASDIGATFSMRGSVTYWRA